MQDKYNFRYLSQRQKFYEDTIAARNEILKKIKDPIKRAEMESDLRVVISIGAFSAEEITDWSSIKNEQGAGRFRGYRSFAVWRLLRTFLTGSNYSGVFSRSSSAARYTTVARLVTFKRRGKRVTGEKVFVEWQITNK